MTRVFLPLLAMIIITGCTTTPHDATKTATDEATDSRTLPPGTVVNQATTPIAMSFGRGIARAADDLTFMVNVEIFDNKKVAGTFSYSAESAAGNLDIEAEVTCIRFDHAAGRGWIGGRLSRNDSSDARYAGQDGDVWIRILDRNLAGLPPMISAPQFPTDSAMKAATFCSQQPWPDDGLFVVQPGALAIFP